MDTTTVLPKRSGNVGRRLVLMPLPFQGHINPMLQLANILHSKAFSILILHTCFNSPNPTNYPHFTFIPIPSFDHSHSVSDISNVFRLLHYLNGKCLDPIWECLARLMSEDQGVSCLITDAQWFGTQSVADDLKLPRIVHRTSNVSSFLSFAAFPLLRDMGYIRPFSNQEMKSKALVPGLEPLKVKDLPKLLTSDPKEAYKILELMVQGTRAARGVIWNTFKDLEHLQLSSLTRDFPNPHFLIGPFHKCFPALSSNLLTPDQTSISWLDTHLPNSVLYVSFGSLANVEESQFLEIAWGLANSKQPFLWVVRPGSVQGFEWLEALPNGFLEKIAQGRGYIVKWAPQQDVLAHPATGAFLTHNGWNSTLESICEGVPMICSPCFGDQPPNARYVSDVWKIGVVLENGLERGEIENAIKRVMVDTEGLDMRDRVLNLKEKANLCLKKGGSSYTSLEDLVNYILSL